MKIIMKYVGGKFNEEEIEKTTMRRYRSKQEFILECVREKLDKLERQQEAEA